MNDVIAKLVEEDPETEDGKRKIQKLVDRDVKKLRNDVDRQVSQCKQDCPSECDSCGSAMIEELKLKLLAIRSPDNKTQQCSSISPRQYFTRDNRFAPRQPGGKKQEAQGMTNIRNEGSTCTSQ